MSDVALHTPTSKNDESKPLESTPPKAPAKILDGPQFIVVGAGPVGTRCATEIRKRFKAPCSITVFGDEPYAPYDRIKLTQLLAGNIHYPDIFWSLDVNEAEKGHPDSQLDFVTAAIDHINPVSKIAVDSQGNQHPYDYIILATGSSPHIPNITGTELSGVYTFRNIRDTEGLIARINRSRHVVVVGGGLLGLEAAKGLQRNNTQVTLVHQAPRLMNRQLSEGPAEELLEQVKAQGIQVITNDGLRKVHGDIRVDGITTRQGKFIECDTVVLCTGIKPNTGIAQRSGIAFNRGIIVDETLKTSANCVYAIGECSEFKEEVFGLVAPGLEQASVLATNLAGGNATFSGTQPYTKLKVMDTQVNSLGLVADFIKRPKLSQIERTKTKKGKTLFSRSVTFYKGHIIGACGVGEWPELQRIREAYLQERFIFPWQLLWFRLTGNIWFTQKEDHVSNWPANAVVCQCNQVSKDSIEGAVAQGANSVAAVGSMCNAGTVCGSCQPLLQTLVDENMQDLGEAVELPSTGFLSSPSLMLSSVIAFAIAAAILFLPSIPAPTSVQEASLSWLWTDTFYKQVSGFSLLGVTALGLILSIRKRFRWQFLGNFSRWRLVHAIFGVLALVILLAHTGLSLGDNLNQLLMINFLGAALIGSVLGVLISSTKVSTNNQTFRKLSFWMHVLTVWPLPVLITAHIVSSYYF
ncbi:FAD-dependent oxidoreductase [Aurantivibrio plasticivorans]